MDILSGLNPEQRQAVEFSDRHLLVVAGAGSGKTRVLTHKIVYLIENVGVRPDQILAMTFSNKAAQEMKERIHKMLPSYGQPRWIGTFHSVCLRILKEFHELLGYTKDFSIYDDGDQISILKKIVESMDLDPKKYAAKVIRYHIDKAKNETTNILDYLKNDPADIDDKTLEIIAAYQKTLEANQAMDFGDILGKTLQLMENHEQVQRAVHHRWKRLLIDEYQDTNVIQKQLIQRLCPPEGIVCAVGDEDQSIYAWRGARVENMMTFPDDFPGAEIIKLEQNYRSTKRILGAANAVIKNNAGRRSKDLWTQNPEGEMLSFFHAEDDYGEARFVIDQVEKLTLRGSLANSGEIAIFYRTHVQSRLLEEECRRKNLAYKILGGTRFFDRLEIKDVLAYLRLALNPKDNISFLRAVNTPSRGIGKQTLESLGEVAGEKELSLFEAIPYFPRSKKSEKALYDFYLWYDGFRGHIGERAPAEIAEELLAQSGYLKALEQEKTIEAESRLENIQELLRSMEEFYEETQGNLGEYLDRVSLVAATDEYQEGIIPIVMMTVHNSKGLEFDHVFIVGAEENIFPHQRALEFMADDELEEERRLCYVAMTRARKRLFITAAARRHLYKNIQFNSVSRFVGEIPQQYIVHLENPETRFTTKPTFSKPKTFRAQQQVDEFRQESYDDENFGMYNPGTKIAHPEFGEGVIKKCEGTSSNLKVTVHFKSRGIKKLALNYCTIEILNR